MEIVAIAFIILFARLTKFQIKMLIAVLNLQCAFSMPPTPHPTRLLTMRCLICSLVKNKIKCQSGCIDNIVDLVNMPRRSALLPLTDPNFDVDFDVATSRQLCGIFFGRRQETSLRDIFVCAAVAAVVVAAAAVAVNYNKIPEIT